MVQIHLKPVFSRKRTKTIHRHWQQWEDKKEEEDNPQTLATMGRQERGRRQAKYKNTAQL
jgi:hypothetical protein